MLAEKAGPELAKACSKLRPLKSGLVKETDAYQIRTCKKIFHCHCPKYKNGDKEVRHMRNEWRDVIGTQFFVTLVQRAFKWYIIVNKCQVTLSVFSMVMVPRWETQVKKSFAMPPKSRTIGYHHSSPNSCNKGKNCTSLFLENKKVVVLWWKYHPQFHKGIAKRNFRFLFYRNSGLR